MTGRCLCRLCVIWNKKNFANYQLKAIRYSTGNLQEISWKIRHLTVRHRLHDKKGTTMDPLPALTATFPGNHSATDDTANSASTPPDTNPEIKSFYRLLSRHMFSLTWMIPKLMMTKLQWIPKILPSPNTPKESLNSTMRVHDSYSHHK